MSKYKKLHLLTDAFEPADEPLGDGHHTDAPFTSDDDVIADKLAWYMGTLHLDYNTPEELWEWWYYKRTSVDEWKEVVRALRIHGLKIVNAEGPRAASKEVQDQVADVKTLARDAKLGKFPEVK